MNQYSSSPFGGMPPVVKNLLIINALLLILKMIFIEFFQYDLDKLLGLHHPQSEYFHPYQFVTHLFMHGDIMHLVFNMFALWMFGRVLEQTWGGKRFFIFYIVTGLGAALLHTLVNAWEVSNLQAAADLFYSQPTIEQFELFVREYIPGKKSYIYDFIVSWKDSPDTSAYQAEARNFVEMIVKMKLDVTTVGASGAVFGVLLGFGMLFPNVELMLLFPPIPVKAKWMVIAYGAIELYLGVAQYEGDNIAHFAHLGGMIFGFILIKLWQKPKRHSQW